MPLKPWHKVVTPREDLREDRPLDASEFAVHLDQIRDGRAPADYQDPTRFFERTYLTRTLSELATGVVRRLAGVKVETSAVYNLATQFGGGKTHALALLYHLAHGGPDSAGWKGVSTLLSKADVRAVPRAATAVFVGTEFDSLTGRGGSDGTPKRLTPWGELAWQLSGAEGFAAVARHEQDQVAPSSEVIRKFLPTDRPALILMDELMNYVSRNRKSGLATQFYHFLQNLSEEARGHDNVALVVSIPASELEMTAEDQGDYDRIKKLLDRLGRAMIMSAEQETSEIIRRRLFEWSGLPDEAKKVAAEYSDWVQSHRTQLPNWFPADAARDAFAASYPFHPTVLSVFERKWRALPRFQQTRGVLRLLALWVARAYKDGYAGGAKDALITLGSAPLDDALFRPAAFEQLGETNLEGPVTTDICGKKEAIAIRLDKEAPDTLRKARLHQKVATTIFFESNGGQTRTEASLPEIRLAVAEPDLDIGNVETALDALSEGCYFLTVEKAGYRFSTKPNLNKLLADRRASIPDAKISERVRIEVEAVFKSEKDKSVGLVLFPSKSGDIPDRAALTLVVLSPEQDLADRSTRPWIEASTRECGATGRTFKSGLIFAVPESASVLREEARKLLAWEDVAEEQDEKQLDESQRRQVREGVSKSKRDFRDAIWRAYKNLFLLGRGNEWKTLSLGHVNASAAETMIAFVLQQLQQNGDIEKAVGPQFLVRKWPPALSEWSTKAVRDVFFASPEFPRLLDPNTVKDTLARGVSAGDFALVTKGEGGKYGSFRWNATITAADIELSEDLFVIRREQAKAYDDAQKQPAPVTVSPSQPPPEPKRTPSGRFAHVAVDSPSKPAPTAPTNARKLSWSGEVPARHWMSFYRRVLTNFVQGGGLKLVVQFEIEPPEGISTHRVDETRAALQELELDTKLDVE